MITLQIISITVILTVLVMAGLCFAGIAIYKLYEFMKKEDE